ncbi:unnamed protein product [Amoebophrya sp. A120]|nr:unnamed protein product [Amoebophrya sp. A120]|eukprot:GSA120T00025423001.1
MSRGEKQRGRSKRARPRRRLAQEQNTDRRAAAAGRAEEAPKRAASTSCARMSSCPAAGSVAKRTCSTLVVLQASPAGGPLPVDGEKKKKGKKKSAARKKSTPRGSAARLGRQERDDILNGFDLEPDEEEVRAQHFHARAVRPRAKRSSEAVLPGDEGGRRSSLREAEAGAEFLEKKHVVTEKPIELVPKKKEVRIQDFHAPGTPPETNLPSEGAEKSTQPEKAAEAKSAEAGPAALPGDEAGRSSGQGEAEPVGAEFLEKKPASRSTEKPTELVAEKEEVPRTQDLHAPGMRPGTNPAGEGAEKSTMPREAGETETAEAGPAALSGHEGAHSSSLGEAEQIGTEFLQSYQLPARLQHGQILGPLSVEEVQALRANGQVQVASPHDAVVRTKSLPNLPGGLPQQQNHFAGYGLHRATSAPPRLQVTPKRMEPVNIMKHVVDPLTRKWSQVIRQQVIPTFINHQPSPGNVNQRGFPGEVDHISIFEKVVPAYFPLFIHGVGKYLIQTLRNVDRSSGGDGDWNPNLHVMYPDAQLDVKPFIPPHGRTITISKERVDGTTQIKETFTTHLHLLEGEGNRNKVANSVAAIDRAPPFDVPSQNLLIGTWYSNWRFIGGVWYYSAKVDAANVSDPPLYPCAFDMAKRASYRRAEDVFQAARSTTKQIAQTFASSSTPREPNRGKREVPPMGVKPPELAGEPDPLLLDLMKAYRNSFTDQEQSEKILEEQKYYPVFPMLSRHSSDNLKDLKGRMPAISPARLVESLQTVANARNGPAGELKLEAMWVDGPSFQSKVHPILTQVVRDIFSDALLFLACSIDGVEEAECSRKTRMVYDLSQKYADNRKRFQNIIHSRVQSGTRDETIVRLIEMELQITKRLAHHHAVEWQSINQPQPDALEFVQVVETQPPTAAARFANVWPATFGGVGATPKAKPQLLLPESKKPWGQRVTYGPGGLLINERRGGQGEGEEKILHSWTTLTQRRPPAVLSVWSWGILFKACVHFSHGLLRMLQTFACSCDLSLAGTIGAPRCVAFRWLGMCISGAAGVANTQMAAGYFLLLRACAQQISAFDITSAEAPLRQTFAFAPYRGLPGGFPLGKAR